MVRLGMCVVVVLPLYVSPALLFPFVTGRSFAFRIVIEVLLVPWIGLLLLSPTYRPPRSALTKAMAVFVGIVAVADVLGANPSHSFWSNFERMEGLDGLLHIALFFLIVVSVFQTMSEWLIFLYCSSIAGVVVSLIALLQTLSPASEARIAGTFGNPVYLASFLMLDVFVLGFLIARERRRVLRGAMVGAIALELSIIYFTAARGVLLALLFVGTALAARALVHFAPHRWRRRRRVLAAAVLVVGLAGAGAWLASSGGAFVRGSQVLSRATDTRTVRSRLLLWEIAWSGVKERPLLGWGQENFYLVFATHYRPALITFDPAWFDRTHDMFLDWLIHAGILGLGAYLAVLALGARNLRRARARRTVSRSEAWILGGMLAAYAIANFFVFDTLQTYVLIFGVLAFSDYLADRAPVDDELPEEPPAPGGTKGQLVVAAIAAAVVAVVPMMYALSVRPMLAAREIAAGVDVWTVGRPVPEMQQHFEQAVAYGGFARPEAGDWIAKLVPDVIRGRGRGTREQIESFVGVAIRELHALTVAPAADVKHLVVLGDVYTRAAKLDASYAARAVEVLTRALERWPMNPKIYFELATAHEVAGDGARAIATMQAAVALVPDYPEAQLRLALTAWRAGRRDLAESAISRFQSLRIRPERESAQLYRRLAALLRDMGDRKGAVLAARKVVELDPSLRSAGEEFIREIEGPPRPR